MADLYGYCASGAAWQILITLLQVGSSTHKNIFYTNRKIISVDFISCLINTSIRFSMQVALGILYDYIMHFQI